MFASFKKCHMQPNSFNTLEEFVSGTVLLIDKPIEWTSFDVLNRIKIFVRNNIKIPKNDQGHEQRFKIGHAGTLDPLATGLLVVCTGKLTKSIDSLQGGEKEYTGTIAFGQTTPSYDLETTPEGDFPTGHFNLALIQEKAMGFLGEQWQIPPGYSAKHVDGERAYKSARLGKPVEIPPVKITINEFQIPRYENAEADFLIRCSKGTYIRTIAHDIGKNLDSGAHLIKLRRTMSYPFRIEDALTLPDLMMRLERITAIKTS